MVHIYTFCDKTLVGKKDNSSAKFLCENLYKMNFRIDEVCTFCNSYDFSTINFRNKDIYFLLMQKSNATLNSYLAQLTNSELVENELLKQTVHTYHKNNNLPIDKSCELEWVIPKVCAPITNPNGKTQGFVAKLNECEIFVLPSDYEQLKRIYFDCLLEHLENNFNSEYKSETYKVFGLTEANLYEVLKDKIKNKDKVSISIFSRGLDNDVVIKSRDGNEHFDKYRQEIFNILEKYIYSVQDLSLIDNLSKVINDSNVNISFAGDMSIVQLISQINKNCLLIQHCDIMLDKTSKINYGINQNIISQYGEYSAEVAYNLAVLSLQKHSSDIALVSIVDKNEKRGTAYIAIGNSTKIDIYKNLFIGTEQEIDNNIAQTALFYLNKKLALKDFQTIK